MDGQRIIKYGLVGSPDIIGFTNKGVFIGIECKTGNATKSKKQICFHNIAQKFGAICLTVKSVDELREKLQAVLT
jgi:hypothetical protein